MDTNGNSKPLLIKDLSQRLPYGVKVKCPSDDEPYTLLSINWNKEIVVIGFMMDGMYVTSKQKLVDIKPYLRPMSSMTEEEKKSLPFPWVYNFGEITSYTESEGFLETTHDECLRLIDWLNTHHFDYRGLIEKGLAIEITEEDNPYKD